MASHTHRSRNRPNVGGKTARPEAWNALAVCKKRDPQPFPLVCGILLMVALAILTGHYFYGGVMRPVLAYPSYGVLAVAGALALPLLLHSKAPKTPLFLCTLLVAWLFVHSILSNDTLSGAHYLHLALSASLAFLLVSHGITSSKARLVLLTVFLFAGVAQAGIGLAQSRGWLPHVPQGWYSEQLRLWYQRDGLQRASGTAINPNHLCWFLNSTLLFAFAHALLGKGNGYLKAGLWLLTALMTAASLLTGSRGGIISLASGLLVLNVGVSVVIFTLWHHRTQSTRYLRLLPGFAALWLIPAGILLAVGHQGPLRQRLELLLNDSYRPDLWQVALQKIGQSPWIGGGPGSFIHFSRLHRNGGQREDYFAHNDWLQCISDYGWVGLILFASLVLWLFASAIRHFLRYLPKLQTEPQSNRAAILLGALASLTAFCVHSVFDFNLQIPANALYAAAVCGLLVIPNHHTAKRTVLPVAVVGILSLALILSLCRWRNEWHWLKAENALLRRDLTRAYVEAKKGLGISEHHPKLQALFAEVVMHQLSRNPHGAVMLLAEAERALRQAIALSPNDRSYYVRLAEVLLRQAQYHEAAEVAGKAIALAPRQAYAYELQGQAYELLGELQKAEACYAIACRQWNIKNARKLLTEVRKKLKEQQRSP